MDKVELRFQRLSDAKRFYEILNNPNFRYFPARPESIEDERDFLKQNRRKRENNFEYNYSIIYKGKLVGASGIKINQHSQYVGEIGFFVDESYWNQGIASKAVRLLEKVGFEKLNLKRIEILMVPKNKASEKVALKCGYKKEGLLKKRLLMSGKYQDVYLYAKTI